ncbi:MAG TPA: VOC family protein [Candidatus Acidoferrum sp.]|jgi:catechol 2,3-dioxygenase-like lactoylglutathione lyase family enzyme|nr:VOC family protein [Candidatus Acidoferrum sp.]
MITGVHAIFYTKRAKEMYDFLRDVLGLHYVDAGNGRLFFAAPPTELAVHETNDDPEHELWLICDDITATVQLFENKGVKTTPIVDRGWGLVTTLELAGGDKLGLYEPKHLSPLTPPPK